MIAPPKVGPPPEIQSLSFNDWMKGTVTAYDNGRTPLEGLRRSGNQILSQNGTLGPRPSLVRYGTQPSGTVLGEIFEFVRLESGIPVNYMLIMQNIGGTTKPAYSKDGGAWTTINGKSYDNDAQAHFIQIDEKILVMNGVDNLSYVNIPTLAAIPYVALSTPSAPTPVKTGLTGTTYTYYYKVTANSTVGETAASTAGSITVGSIRDVWDASSNYVTISWSSVASAVSYNLYIGDVAGQETLLASGINGLSFKDDGSAYKDITRLAPVGDTTAGPKVTRGSVINGQLFFTGDTDYPQYIRFGGTAGSIMDLSPFNGGGYIEVGKGTKEFPVRVMSFRTGQGQSAITVLCRGTNGMGKRYIMSPDSITVGEIVISFFTVTEDNGQDGTDSPDGVILYRDSLYYPSKDGFKTTGTKPQLQNLLSTSTISETISDSILRLDSKYMDKCVGLANNGRLYWALPVGNTTNNEIWVLDLDRKGAWMKPWGVAADWMMMYNDNTGTSHHIVLENNEIFEFSYNTLTNDDGVPFTTGGASGFIKFSDNGMEWAKVIDITFVLLRPQGTVTFTVAGKTEDDDNFSAVSDEPFIATSTVAGWGEAGWGGDPSSIFGWSNFEVVPEILGESQVYHTIEVDEEFQWISWEINSAVAGVDYQLSDVIIRFVNVGVKDLT